MHYPHFLYDSLLLFQQNKKLDLDSSKINKGFFNLKKSDLNEKTRRIERMADVDIQKIEKYIELEILKGIVKLPSF